MYVYNCVYIYILLYRVLFIVYRYGAHQELMSRNTLSGYSLLSSIALLDPAFFSDLAHWPSWINPFSLLCRCVASDPNA